MPDRKPSCPRCEQAQTSLSSSLAHGARLVEALRGIRGNCGWNHCRPDVLCSNCQLAQTVLSKTPAEVKEWVEGVRNNARAEALEAGFKASEIFKPKCYDKAHDDRWCAHCESMGDGVDQFGLYLIEQACDIRAQGGVA